MFFEPNFEVKLHGVAPLGMNDAEFNKWMEGENERLDGLFVESQNICRANPQWLADLEPTSADTIRKISSTIEWPVICRGQTMRTDPVPEPEIADEFVRFVVGMVRRDSEIQEWRNDVDLGIEGLRNEVNRVFMSFKDFDRNARTGEPNPGNPDNVRAFIRMQRLALRWNNWFQRQEIGKWRSGRDTPDSWEALTDSRIGQLMTQAGDTQHQFRPAEALFRRTLETIARENTFDPVVDHLSSLQWDGKARLDEWLPIACGVPRDSYHRAVGRNLIGGMVKRARKPGAKHDEVVIFMGPQGTYKSTLCQILALKPEFFTDSVSFDGSPQNLVPQLFGKWVIELGELDGMASRETSFLKRFISATSDTVTLKYKALSSDHARRCIFIGTSNDDRVLRDATGNRRFLPVRIDRNIDVDWVRQNLDQLFAEAAALESAGETFAIPAHVLPEATAAQESARAEADFEIYLENWFGGEAPMLIAAADVSSLLKDSIGRTIQSNRYGPFMRRLGFVDETARLSKKVTRVWRRGNTSDGMRVELTRDQNGRLIPRIPFKVPLSTFLPPPSQTVTAGLPPY